MNEPLISVVLTLRGGVEGARTALASLQEQTSRNWEAVTVAGPRSTFSPKGFSVWSPGRGGCGNQADDGSVVRAGQAGMVFASSSECPFAAMLANRPHEGDG